MNRGHEERIIIASKNGPALNPIQWNALAIMFILVFMPFAVAFVTNAGSSADDNFKDSMESNSGGASLDSIWLFNGGDNLTIDYQNLNPSLPDQFINCAVIEDGWCIGTQAPGVQALPLGGTSYAVDWRTPAASSLIYQSHFYPSTAGQYLGASGDDHYAWLLQSDYFPNIEQGEALDKLRFTFVDTFTSYVCDYSEFTDIEFNGYLIFNHDGESKKVDGFEFETSNKYEHRFWDNTHAEFTTACQVGFEVKFDFAGYESLSISSFVGGGDWQNTSIEVHLTDFERADDRTFTDTLLPFAGDGQFSLSVEHQNINSITAGFVIRSSTLILSLLTFAVGVASTNAWNPFKSFIGGILP